MPLHWGKVIAVDPSPPCLPSAEEAFPRRASALDGNGHCFDFALFGEGQGVDAGEGEVAGVFKFMLCVTPLCVDRSSMLLSLRRLDFGPLGEGGGEGEKIDESVGESSLSVTPRRVVRSTALAALLRFNFGAGLASCSPFSPPSLLHTRLRVCCGGRWRGDVRHRSFCASPTGVMFLRDTRS
jgi:hypothetical protein